VAPCWSPRACAFGRAVSPDRPAPEQTAGPEETERLGARLAATLHPGDLVLLFGEMGAGKTSFVRGACHALGVSGPVTSPTFVVGRRYEGRELRVSHLDLHRLGRLEDEDPGLLADYLHPDRVAFVEWPEAAEDELPTGGRRVHVRLAHLGGDRRRVEIEG